MLLFTVMSKIVVKVNPVSCPADLEFLSPGIKATKT
jgi:hypothetical protein